MAGNNMNSIITTIFFAIVFIILIILIFFLFRKINCQQAFINKFPNGNCIYNALNENLNRTQVNQICNAITNCNYTNLGDQINCLKETLNNFNIQPGSNVLNEIDKCK